jgi:hypothetical protein
MAYLELSCGTNAGNTGLQNCNENFGNWEKLLLVNDDFEIDTRANALLEATWTTAINAAKATRMYPLFEHFNAEPDQEERVQEDGWAGKSETVREGKDRVTFIFKNIAFYNHKELRKHNNRTNLGVYIVTSQGYILGRSEDGIKFLPLILSDFYVGKRSFSDGDTIDRSNVFIEFKDAKQWNDDGVWVQPSAFDPILLDGVKDCNLSGTLGATSATITITGASDSVGIVGLIAANFNLYDDAAPTVPIAVTVAADNGDGTYDLTWPTISGAHTLTLFDQPIGTNGYEANPNGTSGKVSTTV